jgi:hypothetical protein
MLKALNTSVSIPKYSCSIPFKIPDLGARRRIQAIFFMIGGIKSGYRGISSTNAFPGVLVRATIQASSAPSAVPKSAEPAA